MSHIDVNIPFALHPRMHTLLMGFEMYIKEKKIGKCWRVQRPPGNHLTQWWLYVCLSTDSPSAIIVQFGATIFADVNPMPHMYVRGKAVWIGVGLDLLEKFMDRTLRRNLANLSRPQTSVRPSQPTRPPPLLLLLPLRR